MVESLFEYCLSVIDYSYLLFFYLKLIGQKWEWKKAIFAIIIISILQFVKDFYIDFGIMTLMIDKFIVIGFLFLYSKIHTLNTFMYAMIFDGIFVFSVTFFVACAIILGIDIESTRAFASERIIFSTLIKIFTILIFLFLNHPLKKLRDALDEQIENIMLFIMSLILMIFSYL